MALINRVSRLFTADVHAVLDRIEEPDVLLRHAIREMEEEVERTEHGASRLEAERAALTDKRRKVEAQLAELGEQLDVCFEAGNDDLARRLIKRRIESERLAKHFAERCSDVDKALAERRAKLQEQREHLDVMRQKAELVLETRAPAAGPDDWGRAELNVGDDEVEVAFLRERQRRAKS